MDPMQIQNQQAQIPANPYGQAVPQQYIPTQQIPQQGMQMPVYPAQQVVTQPVQQSSEPQESFFDKFLKGVVNFIAKLSAPTPQAPQTVAQPIQQPVMQPIQTTVAPQAGGFFGQIGSTLGTIANKAESGFGSVVEGAQNYVTQPVEPTAPVNMQSFLAQNYQQTIPQQQIPVPPQQVPVPPQQIPVPPQQA